MKCNSDKLLSFDIFSSSLDAFYGQGLHRNPKFSSLWKVMICIIFTFSNCQGQIERGFSISKSLSGENMHEKSICAQQLVSDFVKSLNKEVLESEVENELICSFKAS